MGLDIWSSDYVKDFHIGYIGFKNMRGLFILPYGVDLYGDYLKWAKWSTQIIWGRINGSCPIDEYKFNEEIGDLSILIYHSDADGELSSDECKKLINTLSINEELIRKTVLYFNDESYVEDLIKRMYEFKKLIEYCAEHDDVKLIFG